MNTQRGWRRTPDCLDSGSVFGEKCQYLFRSLSGSAGRDLRPFQKEGQPFVPDTLCPDTLKQVVVTIAVCSSPITVTVNWQKLLKK